MFLDKGALCATDGYSPLIVTGSSDVNATPRIRTCVVPAALAGAIAGRHGSRCRCGMVPWCWLIRFGTAQRGRCRAPASPFARCAVGLRPSGMMHRTARHAPFALAHALGESRQPDLRIDHLDPLPTPPAGDRIPDCRSRFLCCLRHAHQIHQHHGAGRHGALVPLPVPDGRHRRHAAAQPGRSLLRTRRPWLQVVRGLLLLLVSLFSFLSLRRMPVGT